MKDATKNWLLLASKELKIAEASLNAHEPVGVVFHLHAAVEKTLKGIYEETKGNPPRIHKLKRLAIDSCKIKLEEDQKCLLEDLDKAFMDSRYPDDVLIFEKDYNIDRCKKLIEDTRKMIKWLKSLMKDN